MNIKEIEKVVASIQSNLFRNSNSFSVGMLKSNFKGAGLQFKEHQLYAPGDDVRFIDWKLSAKSDNTFVKTFEEERNVEIIVMLDITPTMMIGYNKVSKLQSAIEIACLLYLLADKSKDKVKLIIVTDKVTILPSSSGHKGIVLLISYLEKINVLNAEGKVNLDYRNKNKIEDNKRMGLLKSFVARGKEVVLLSDFSEVDDLNTLNKLIYRRNMHCFKITSPVDEAAKKPFSILTKINGKKKLMRAKTQRKTELEGRWKKINVAERYLENFIKEML
jgi:uncharacterized protein (DUF58 family)